MKRSMMGHALGIRHDLIRGYARSTTARPQILSNSSTSDSWTAYDAGETLDAGSRVILDVVQHHSLLLLVFDFLHLFGLGAGLALPSVHRFHQPFERFFETLPGSGVDFPEHLSFY